MSSMLDTAGMSDALAGMAPGGAMPSFEGMLSDFARQNPNLAWLPQMIAAQRHAAATAQADAPPDTRQPEIDALTDELERSQARGARLQRTARRLASQLEVAQDLLADLAAAFGACGLCWGEDIQCLSCRGRGKPGRFAPDADLRLRFSAEPVELPDASRTSTPPGHSERR